MEVSDIFSSSLNTEVLLIADTGTYINLFWHIQWQFIPCIKYPTVFPLQQLTVPVIAFSSDLYSSKRASGPFRLFEILHLLQFSPSGFRLFLMPSFQEGQHFSIYQSVCPQVDEEIALRYQKVMAEWKACEVIVKQREKESHSATLAKFSSGSSIDSHVQRLIHRDSTISNDVSIPFQNLYNAGCVCVCVCVVGANITQTLNSYLILIY